MTDPVVLVWVGTRADLFPLGPVIEALGRADGLRTRVVASDAVGDLLGQVELSGVDVHRLSTPLSVAGRSAQLESGPRLAIEFSQLLTRWEPAAILVLGDRWELLYVVPPAVLAGIPIVHLHGGELTEGAIDDRVRHAVSKLADLHCVSTAGAARRLRQLGEPTDRVVVTGAPSLDRLAGVRVPTDPELARMLGGVVVRPLALATYHPATAADEDPGLTVDAMLEALLATTGTAVVTAPGLDAGRETIVARLAAAAAAQPSLRLVANLGASYPRVMAAADVVVGNSSSGILEAASLSMPVVDIGLRQAGRERGSNVITVGTDAQAIATGIRRALTPAFRDSVRRAGNPYGDGHAADRIVAVTRRAVHGLPAGKPFIDHLDVVR